MKLSEEGDRFKRILAEVNARTPRVVVKRTCNELGGNVSRRHRVLIGRDQIAERVAELGRDISAVYAGDELVLICVLKGSFVFMADLIREIKGVNVICEFLGVSSYEGTKTTGVVQITQDLRTNIDGVNVLIVEDIVDTGRTLDFLRRTLKQRKPKSLKVVTLLDKPSRREVEVKVNWIGFEIENKFVVGYGLDHDELHRNLPDVCELVEDNNAG